MRRLPHLAVAALAVLIAAFFAFVGWKKAFASLADLARYGAWTVHVPEALGRVIGWSEMACAAALIWSRTRCSASLILIANQFAAAAVHAARGEWSALPQNAVLIALLAAIAWHAARRMAQKSPAFS